MRARKFFAPGRVNLIGEHTDYNDGFVLPMAIDYGTFTKGIAREDRLVKVRSNNLAETIEFDLDSQNLPQRGSWWVYIEGMARVLESKGLRLKGADLEIESTVPIGGGLSSSTALELSFALAMLSLAEQEFDRVQLALAAQQTEHTYVGTRGGLMDQLTSLFGRKGHALLIDCRSLEIKHIPIDATNFEVAICDTKVKHNLASSEYNTRRAECEHGVEILQQQLPGIRALRDVSVAEFELYQDTLPEPIKRRCRHVITENERTLQSADALSKGDFETIGNLMLASHVSLRDDYEVSSDELDLLVEIASSIEGVVGARMTGGGFGGCTVNLVRRDALEIFQQTIAEKYTAATNIAPAIYFSDAGDGAKEITGTEA
jgi:galactokinase